MQQLGIDVLYEELGTSSHVGQAMVHIPAHTTHCTWKRIGIREGENDNLSAKTSSH